MTPCRPARSPSRNKKETIGRLAMEKEITREAVVTPAIPTGSIAVILAVRYQVVEQEMASVLFFSTIFSVLQSIVRKTNLGAR
jgi:hypothetical protein